MANKLLIPDKANCTYWWIIYLDTNNPENRAREMHGYSKFQNQNEAKSKEQVLMAKVEMLYKNGYLDRSTHIEIFKRRAPLPNKNEDMLILTLYPQDYLIPTEILGKYPFGVLQFLKKFYAAIRDGKEIKNLRPLPDKTKHSRDDMYKIYDRGWKNVSQLQEYCLELLKQGEALGMVEGFQRKYMATYFKDVSKSDVGRILNTLTNNFKAWTQK